MSRFVVGCVVVAYCVVAAVVAVRWPLLAYSTSLALFGLTHVLSELRYVDARFGDRLPRTLWAQCAVPLALIVGLRCLRMADVIGNDISIGGEMALVVVLVGLAVPVAFARARVVGVVGVAIVAALVAATLVSPLHVLLTFSVLHNATPFGFIVERAEPAKRARTIVVAALVFVGVPLLVASGVLTRLMSEGIDLDLTALPTVGKLADHLAVYLAPELRDDVLAAQLFSGAVAAQLLHYGAVIIWLPRSLGADERPTLPWPRARVFAVVVVALSLGLFVHFWFDFKGARFVYGIVAAVHAWIELPVLLAGFASLSKSPTPTSPTSSHQQAG